METGERFLVHSGHCRWTCRMDTASQERSDNVRIRAHCTRFGSRNLTL